MLQHFDGVVGDQPQVCEPAGLDLEQAMPDARRMHLNADEIGLRRCRGKLDERVAAAETDFQHAARAPSECRVKVERPGRVGNP